MTEWSGFVFSLSIILLESLDLQSYHIRIFISLQKKRLRIHENKEAIMFKIHLSNMKVYFDFLQKERIKVHNDFIYKCNNIFSIMEETLRKISI